MEQKVILLVEDNRDDAALTLHAFKKSNIRNQVAVIETGLMALDYLFATGAFAERDPSVLPELVLLDLHLPGMGGVEVLRRIRENERTRTLPVAVFVSSDQDRTRIEAFGLGVNGYIRKPINFTQMMEVTSQLGLSWLIVREMAFLADEPKSKAFVAPA